MVFVLGDFNTHIANNDALFTFHGQFLTLHKNMYKQSRLQKKRVKLWTYMTGINDRKSQMLVNNKWKTSIKDLPKQKQFKTEIGS